MSYLDSENSMHGGKPVELFKFAGTYTNFYYTSGAEKVTYDGNDYLPTQIQRTEVVAGTQNDDNVQITIDMPVYLDVIQQYGFQATPPALELTIYRFHSLDDVVPYWVGKVTNITVKDAIATILSPSTLGAALAANMPTVYWQLPCNNLLGDARCKVNMTPNTFATTITAIDASGQNITVAGIGTLDGKLVGGDFCLDSLERRMITAQSGDVLTVNYPFAGAEVSGACTLQVGCDHSYTGDCLTRFNNQVNYGGFPFIPAVNPFSAGIEPAATPIPDTTCLPPVFLGTHRYFRWFFSVPCNGSYTPTRNLSVTSYQPNPPYGKTINVFNAFGSEQVFENDDFINPSSPHYRDPAYSALRGQLLVDLICENLQIEGYFYNAPPLAVSLEVEYGAGFCGSVSLDHGHVKVDVCSVTEDLPVCTPSTIDLGDIVGDAPETYGWDM